MDEFEEIYRLYFNDVYRYLLKLCRNQHIAEDITSDTFFKAMKAMDKFRNESDLRVWLCQIAKNSYYSYLRKHNQTQYVEEMEILDSLYYQDNLSKDFNDKEEVMAIHQILHNLEEPYKEVFHLRFFTELSFIQIGNLFGKTENWACVTYHRARFKIKQRMEEKGYESM